MDEGILEEMGERGHKMKHGCSFDFALILPDDTTRKYTSDNFQDVYELQVYPSSHYQSKVD